MGNKGNSAKAELVSLEPQIAIVEIAHNIQKSK